MTTEPPSAAAASLVPDPLPGRLVGRVLPSLLHHPAGSGATEGSRPWGTRGHHGSMEKLMSIAVAAALAAGGGEVAAADSPGGEIWQRTFRSVSVTEDGQPRALVSGTRIRIEFPNGALRAGAGCGVITGSAALTAARLTVTGLNLLRSDCSDEAAYAQDAWLAAFLDRDPAVELDGHDLVLSDERTRLALTDNPGVASDPPLVGTYWIIEALVEDGVTTPLPPFPQPYLIIYGDGRLVAYAGCNWITGSALLRDGGALLGEAGMTKRACATGNPILEERVFAALDAGEVTLRIRCGRLTVDRVSGPTLLLRSES